MFQVGDVVERYTILAHLRSGGMAELFLARRDGAMGFRRLVAIKVVHTRHAEDEHLVRMFLDEALISARIDHPNVVHVEDLGEVDETYFLVMEYVHGCSLAQLMRVLGRMHRRLSPLVAVAIAARVAEGLHAAHETTDDSGNLIDLVHRDVSPQNILLSHRGHVKLIDFGVAKAELRSEKTNVAMLKGKLRYMPPEQATTGIVDRRSDVYSLGIVLWEMLTMRRLFSGKTEFEVLLKVRDPEIDPPSRFVGGIPAELDEVLLAALSPDPDGRPASAKTFRRMLARALPRAMSLDSAHLAELMLSIVGEELEETLHELPQEVSRQLEAEQLRVALAHREDVTGSGETTDSAVEIMTVHSKIVAFEEDELDEVPSASAPAPLGLAGVSEAGSDELESLTTPAGPMGGREAGRDAPATQKTRTSRPPPDDPPKEPSRAPSASAALGVISSQDDEARDAETEDDADPTVVGSVPSQLLDPAAPAPAAAAPAPRRERSPTSDLPPGAEGVRPSAAWALAAAVVASVVLGVIVALLWP